MNYVSKCWDYHGSAIPVNEWRERSVTFCWIVNLSSVKCHLPNHVQAKENGEEGSWWCEKQHSRSEHPNPVLLKGESQLQIQHKRCFPTFCTCSQQMGGQVPLRERQTPTLHCKKMRTIWALKEIHDDALSPVFFFFLHRCANCLINYCTHYYPQMGKWSQLLEEIDYIKSEVWIWHWSAVAPSVVHFVVSAEITMVCILVLQAKKHWGQGSVW